MVTEKQNVNVVIVGAGPVGLLNAIGLLSKSPNLKVAILEKYEEYKRHHVVQMDSSQIAKYIKAIGEPVDPVLKQLLNQVKANKHIRTSDIEQQLRARALDLGVEIKVEEVIDVQEQVIKAYPNATLILGADGTHSVVSKQIWGDDNIQKFPFDHVLQLRFEIDGDVEKIELPALVQFMQSYGLTCDEYVGKKDMRGKTPVTFQLMISKEQFDRLYPVATSKNPILPFSKEAKNLELVDSLIMQRLKGYLGFRLSHYTPKGQIVNLEEAKISVNEAPATRAKKVYKRQENRDIVLVGDAAMGLSYFKGLNAGVESSAKLLPALTANQDKRAELLNSYNHWFDTDYAPGKVKEVEQFSIYRINLIIKVFRFFNYVLGKEFFMLPDESERQVDLYLGYLTSHKQKTEDEKNNHNWVAYPHRQGLAGNVLTLLPIPEYFVQKVWKHIKDTVAAYKSSHHLLTDLVLPLYAFYHLASGLFKLAVTVPVAVVVSGVSLFTPGNKTRAENLQSIWTKAVDHIVEADARIFLGLTLAVSSILIVPRLVIRGIKTLSVLYTAGPLLVEKNKGMTKLLEQTSSEGLSIERINALCADIHRKYKKATSRGQATQVDGEQEEQLYKVCKPHQSESYDAYLRLFRAEPRSESCQAEIPQTIAAGSAMKL